MRTRTLSRRLIGLLVAVVLIAPFGALPAAGAGCPGKVADKGTWLVIDAPRFPKGEQAILDHVAVSGHLLVTNGVSVMWSRDRGCSWQQTFALPDAPGAEYPFSSANSHIVAMETMGAGALRVALMIEETTTPLGRPHMVVGSAQGSQIGWTLGDSGLPPAGTPRLFATSKGNPSAAYMVIDAAGATDLLLASTDGARSWQPRAALGGTTITDLDVDPLDENSLWGASDSGLYHSTDGGQSFTAVDEFANVATGPVDLYHARNEPARLVVYQPNDGSFLWSLDGGEVFGAITSPGDPTSLTSGASRTEITMTAKGRVWAFHAPSFSWLDLRSPVAGLDGIVGVVKGATAQYVGRTSSSLALYEGPSPTDLVIDRDETFIDVPLLQTPELPDLPPPSLAPARTNMKLDLGESRTVNYHLNLFQRRAPIDVVFLVDTTTTMQPYIQGLIDALAGIVNGLAERGIDVQFGLAEHRAYPDSFPPREPEGNFVYRKVLDIGATPQELANALSNLEADFGGQYTAQLGALHEIATGAGQDLRPQGPLGHDVPAGGQMNFRSKAIHVVIEGTDDKYANTDSDDGSPLGVGPTYLSRTPDIPDLDQVIDELNAKDIKQIGIAVRPKPLAIDGLMRDVAEGTGALAPAEGVDCNGDGSNELPAGEPLACLMQREDLERSDGLATGIVNLIEAVRDNTSIELRTSGDLGVISEVTPQVHEAVQLDDKTTLDFSVTFHCTTRQAGHHYDVAFEPASPDAGVLQGANQATAGVSCSRKPVDEPVPPVLFALPLVGLVPPPLPPPAPPGASATASQVNAQSQFNAQAAAAKQEQQQPQLAFVHAQHVQQEQLATEEYEMSDYRRHRDREMPPGLLYGAALLMGAAFSLAMRTRTRLRYSRIR